MADGYLLDGRSCAECDSDVLGGITMSDNEIKREITFEEEFSCLEKDVKDFFGNYENQSGGEDCIEVCLIRSGYRAAKKAREEINRQKAEIAEI